MSGRLVNSVVFLVCLLSNLFGFEGAYAADKPRKFIFLIHGLNGNAQTFGKLDSILEEHGSLIQKGTEIKVFPLAYDTGRDGRTPYDFAVDVGIKIIDKIGDLRSSDQITFVAHSQGGLISWILLLRSLANDDEFLFFRPYALKTDGLITLGSPMWGSKMADLMSDSEILRKLARKANARLGDRELNEMSYSSDTSVRFSRRAAMMERMGIKLPFRVQSVAGLLPERNDPDLKNGLSTFQQITKRSMLGGFQAVFGLGWNKRAESDLAVAIPSARADFIHLKDPESAKKNQVLASDFGNFKDPSIRELVIVRGAHASMNKKQYYDIAEVPEECRDLRSPCTHPTYGLILQFAMECTAKNQNCSQNEHRRLTNFFLESPDFKKRTHVDGHPNIERMHLFTMMMVFQMPENYSMPKESDEIENSIFFPEPQTKWAQIDFPFPERRIYNPQESRYYFLLKRGLEIDDVVTHMTHDYEDNLSPAASPKQLRITFQGQVYAQDGQHETYKKLLKDGFKLPFMVKIPGIRDPRYVEALVRPTYSTFIDLDFRQQ